MNHIDIVNKLIGNINPAGDASRDDERFNNLKEMCQLAFLLLEQIHDVGEANKHSHEYSVKRSADYATQFMKSIRDCQ